MFETHETQTAQSSTFDEKMLELDQKARQKQIADEEKAEEESRKNRDFVQYSRKSMKELAYLQQKSGLAGALFTYISMNMNTENKLLVSQETLAEIFEVNRVSISKAIKLLIEKKFLTILKSGNSNIYCLNADVVWSTDNKKKEYAEFKTNVIISKTEQKVRTTRLKQLSLKIDEE